MGLSPGWWNTASGIGISLFIPHSASDLLICPEENGISLLHISNLQNRANFAYLRGVGQVLMLAKELKVAQMKDAADRKADSS